MLVWQPNGEGETRVIDARDVHLRVEDASGSLNNTDSLIESLNLINRTRLTSHNCNNIEPQILGMEISCEAERQGLLLASRNLNIVSRMGEVADHGGRWVSTRCQWLQSRQRASNDGYVDRLGFMVREIEECLCRVPIYKLHAEDLGLWEGSGDRDGEIGGRGWSAEFFFSSLAGVVVSFYVGWEMR